MSNFLNPKQGIKETVNLLAKRLEKLANQMRARPDRLRVDAAYQIPFRDQAEVDEKKGILVTPLAANEAIQQVVYGLTSIYIEPGKQNPRETLRVPGVVALPADWLNELEDLNEVKKVIESLVEQIEDQYERMKLWGTFKYLSSLQTMRQARIVDGPRKIKFYWDAAPSISVKTADQWIADYTKHLKKLHAGCVPTLGELPEDDSSRKFIVGINMLADMGQTKVVQFRSGKPHVRARVTFIDKEPPIIRPVSTPIVYSIGDPVPYISPLSNWEPSNRSARTSTRVKISDKPFMEALYLYLYKEDEGKDSIIGD
ncbi:DNA replication terminus site-binding protein [Pseudomonas sp. MWU12-2323]|uniref:DNA replication terminus site-binding protein n=1 Tax=Pseudomonas sp. MWU12-2323 TaxID=2651296 RepID=UPI00128D1641|nr:DNA replication terminus site-binding protein [Pseudomonas sp. MWU12-2323]MPQ69321.1 hypothetical protein [Pseudomonas sp. MWU12-2323]